MLVDSHCHLDYPDLAADRAAIIMRAKANGVGTMVSISTRVKRFDEIRAIAESHPDVWCTVGTHPHQAHEEPDVSVDDLIALSQHPKCIGIGEAGLDYHYDFSPREAQLQGFLTHIAAARETGLPLVIHAREADEDMAGILRAEMGKGAFKAVLHCFTGGEGLAKTGIDLGLLVSFSGVLTYKSAENLRDIAAKLPLDRLLVETDAPFLAPGKMRGKPNEPAFVTETAKVLADCHGVTPDTLAKQTSDTFFAYFSKAKRPSLT